jgi:hypothetical protein
MLIVIVEDFADLEENGLKAWNKFFWGNVGEEVEELCCCLYEVHRKISLLLQSSRDMPANLILRQEPVSETLLEV